MPPFKLLLALFGLGLLGLANLTHARQAPSRVSHPPATLPPPLRKPVKGTADYWIWNNRVSDHPRKAVLHPQHTYLIYAMAARGGRRHTNTGYMALYTVSVKTNWLDGPLRKNLRLPQIPLLDVAVYQYTFQLWPGMAAPESFHSYEYVREIATPKWDDSARLRQKMDAASEAWLTSLAEPGAGMANCKRYVEYLAHCDYSLNAWCDDSDDEE
ncbi:hypothetical protein P8C59_003416 [Phyllachora maydis]|uniref:Uncharacterized protein n=1 Tax=Phyllachora maydis TaxID=1825666 RepID=A0AAD9I0C7_9PEZI|nr:hypothetical protein P8C59_003416 [Phyllachora maydis]